ncbi:hypothetical protein OsI_11415 [Oryza sativa Indica Group]|uniref:Secreted protein n=1 Tax=Oryza sativa subsp. indica TaxID=39946 RepID=A2XGA7_ORYSI|nr:hypothetical protein OsI_11415 [Oryza sativa Indica Group]
MVALWLGFKTLAVVLSAVGSPTTLPRPPPRRRRRPSTRGRGASPHHPGDAGGARKPVLAVVHGAASAAASRSWRAIRAKGGGWEASDFWLAKLG